MFFGKINALLKNEFFTSDLKFGWVKGKLKSTFLKCVSIAKFRIIFLKKNV